MATTKAKSLTGATLNEALVPAKLKESTSISVDENKMGSIVDTIKSSYNAIAEDFNDINKYIGTNMNKVEYPEALKKALKKVKDHAAKKATHCVKKGDAIESNMKSNAAMQSKAMEASELLAEIDTKLADETISDAEKMSYRVSKYVLTNSLESQGINLNDYIKQA